MKGQGENFGGSIIYKWKLLYSYRKKKLIKPLLHSVLQDYGTFFQNLNFSNKNGLSK